MSQLGLDMTYDDPSGRRPRNRERSAKGPVLIALLSLVVIGMAVFLAIKSVSGGGASDYEGDGSGSAVVVVHSGDSLRIIGRSLTTAGVIASEDSFVQAASVDTRSQGISPGSYTMKLKMSATSALNLLLDPTSRVVNKLAVPEGWRVSRTIAAAAKATGIPVADLKASLARAPELGLPAYAQGEPEGFLFPATYAFGPDATADKVISALLDRFAKAARDTDLEAGAKALGRTPLEVLTVASILEVEAAPGDYDKVARVLYNRLDSGMRLQLDSTVNYALNSADLNLTAEQLATDSPYNTYRVKGLPPGPINSPGEAAIQAALSPAKGKWLYFITTDPQTQTTEFATTYDQFLLLKRKYLANVG
ncbi:MAG: endolytic transglycosylase MltG [Actinomycetes bacterium]